MFKKMFQKKERIKKKIRKDKTQKNGGFSVQSLGSNFIDYLSLKRLHSMVDNLIDKEYSAGIFEQSPEIIIDASLCMIDGTVSMLIWDCISGKSNAVAYNFVSDKLRSFAEKGLSRTAVLMSLATPFGQCAVTRYIKIRDRENEEQEGEKSASVDDSNLVSAFKAGLTIDINVPGNDMGYAVCGKKSKETSYIVSAMPLDGRSQMDSVIFKGVFTDGTLNVNRMIDRIIPLSNYVLSKVNNMESSSMYLCAEQRGDELFVWNLYKMPSGNFIPVASYSTKVPQLETSDTLFKNLNLLEQELIRIKNFIPPEKVIVISNGETMLDGVFELSELTDVLCRIVGIDSTDKDGLMVITDKDACIKGMRLMEKIYAGSRDIISELRRGQ